MTLSSRISLAVSANQTNTLDLGSASATLAKSYVAQLADGTAAGQANRLFQDTRTLAASANEDLDLAGTLVDALGATLTFARVKGLVIAASAANTNNVIVGNATTNGFISWVGAATHTVTLRPGAVLALMAGTADVTGYAVTATTADLLRVANSAAGTPVSYDIMIIGTSV